MFWKRWWVAGFSVVFVVAHLFASDRTSVTYHIDRGSKVWITGTATVGSYECVTFSVQGVGEVRFSERAAPAPHPQKKAIISVSVRSIDCGNSLMNKDLYGALKAEEDSLILFELERTELKYDSLASKGTIGLRAFGNLTVAGTTKKDTINATITLLSSNAYSISGEKKLSMFDFNITPPSAFWGLIKAHKELVVHFQLIATPAPQTFTRE